MRFARSLAVFGVCVFLASRAAWSEQAAMSATSDKLTLDQRVWFATQIYATIQTYFGHWQAVPDFNLDTAYQKYLAQILPSDDRKNFDLATLELVAQLKNGHRATAAPVSPT